MKLSLLLNSFKIKTMKKYLFLLLAFSLFSFGMPSETITLSGKIANASDNKLKIRGESFEKDITLKPDGSFSEKLTINYSGSYMVLSGNNRISLYLAKGTNLSVSADEKDFYKSLKFSGNGSKENQYIAAKNAYVNGINQEDLYKKNETDFLAQMKTIKQDIVKMFDSNGFSDADYTQKEKRNIGYLQQVFILSYVKNHAHFAGIQNFTPSPEFPKMDSTINLDNNADFLFSNPYKQLINIHFNELLEKQLKPEDQFLWKAALPEIKKLKSESIRNSLLYALSYEISPANPDASVLYNELNNLSTNPYFKKEIAEKFNKLQSMSAGNNSPVFDFENHKGGKTSLAALKGKYVYIDVWATWCGPCLREIPALKSMEESFHDKNIAFVSISVDTKKDYEKWKKMVADKQLGGIQLIADNDWNSQFVLDYSITAIPRFILLDPDGKIVNADAPRPSDPALAALLNDLKL